MLIFNNEFVSQMSRIALEEGIYACVVNYVQGLAVMPKVKVN
jgi:hypothetical protein